MVSEKPVTERVHSKAGDFILAEDDTVYFSKVTLLASWKVVWRESWGARDLAIACVTCSTRERPSWSEMNKLFPAGYKVNRSGSTLSSSVATRGHSEEAYDGTWSNSRPDNTGN